MTRRRELGVATTGWWLTWQPLIGCRPPIRQHTSSPQSVDGLTKRAICRNARLGFESATFSPRVGAQQAGLSIRALSSAQCLPLISFSLIEEQQQQAQQHGDHGRPQHHHWQEQEHSWRESIIKSGTARQARRHYQTLALPIAHFFSNLVACLQPVLFPQQCDCHQE